MKKSRISIQMMAVFIAIIFSVFGFMVFDPFQSGVAYIDESHLDPGLTWFGVNGGFQASTAGEPNRYYDPARPTIIFIHGWMPDKVGDPPTFMVDFPIPDQNATYKLDLAAPWVNAGWNIGVYYWHPYSDENFVWDAEDKIWTPNEAVGMRYRDVDGEYHTEGMPPVGVTQLLLDDYLAALKGYEGPEIRIAGHSLGNQLAVNLTSNLIKLADEGVVSVNQIPSRVALLDPFWTPFPKDYLDGMETGEIIQWQIEQRILPTGTLVEWYHSSWLTESTMIRDDIPHLKSKVVYTELDPRYCDLLDQICKHDGAWHVYFLSYGSPPLPECVPDATSDSCKPTGKDGPMASTSNQRIAEMMNLPYYWVQGVDPNGEDGRLTPQTDDDWFHRISENDEME